MLFSTKSLLRRRKRRIRQSGLFDAGWYCKTYPDIPLAGLDPLEHYLQHGDAAGRLPNAYFEPNWYREHAPGARKPGVCALEHYIETGWKRGRDPSRRFSSKLYITRYGNSVPDDAAPLQHFLTRGKFEGKSAFPKSLEYNSNAEVIIEDMVKISQSGLFNDKWYRQFYTDLWHTQMEPVFHFVMHGSKENRQPNPIFQTRWYRDANDLGNQCPLVHYINQPLGAKLDPAPNFHVETYFKEHKDLDPKKVDPLRHFLEHGLNSGNPLPLKPVAAPSEKTKIKDHTKLPVHDGLRGMVDYKTVELSPDSLDFNSKCLNIHWVIPDFAAGGGGHMTIFRMVSFLERAGHKQTIWVHNPTLHQTEEAAADDILKYFQQFTGNVHFLDERFEAAAGDALIATDCWTVWPTMSASNFKRRFYFVQDFEPAFHPMGANYLAAEETYRQDLDCLCASPWLAKMMTENYGRWAQGFWLAADTEFYHPPETAPDNKTPRIAFYSRHFTARRAVELGMLALEVLANRGVKFEVDFFGAPLDFQEAPFKFADHGVASPEHLAELFQQTDIGVVFSATNYSLVPQEMMACGLPIVELKGESTECIFPADTVSLASPHPEQIADAMEKLLQDKKARDDQSEAALKWVRGFSWEKSAAIVETALQERLADFGTDISPKGETIEETGIKASVVIPTYNAGPILDKVLRSVTQQQTRWRYEVLVIDSGSTDETLDIVANYPEVRLHEIDKKDFNHGGTRNLGVELTSGEFIAFLTHDALPANERWLYNLVSSLERYPEAAGGFGKHLPYPEASAFTKRDLNAHFDMFNRYPLCVNENTDKGRLANKDQHWRQVLHFYSDNNSIMRRSVWKKIPYREVKFGEDQVWADDIIKAGYSKVYAVRAAVYHSHDFEPAETQERCKTESAFFKHFFGYTLMEKDRLDQEIENANRHDREWGEKHGLTEVEIEDRMAQNRARLTGYLQGAEADTSSMF